MCYNDAVSTVPVCLPPGTRPSLSEVDAERCAALLRALGDPVRLQLLSLIAESPTGEVCACDLVEPVGRSQPTVSHHLKVLRDAGLVLTRKQASWVCYSINSKLLTEVQEVLTALPISQTRTTAA